MIRPIPAHFRRLSFALPSFLPHRTTQQPSGVTTNLYVLRATDTGHSCGSPMILTVRLHGALVVQVEGFDPAQPQPVLDGLPADPEVGVGRRRGVPHVQHGAPHHPTVLKTHNTETLGQTAHTHISTQLSRRTDAAVGGEEAWEMTGP